MERVGAVADGAEAIKSRHADSGREIPVGPPARTAFLEIVTEHSGGFPGLFVKTPDPVGAFQRRPLEPALGPNRCPGIARLQDLESPLYLGRGVRCRDADVDDCAR